jgi:hypothetical protein
VSMFTPRQVLERQMLIYPLVGGAGLAGLWLWWCFLVFVKTPDPKAAASDATIWFIIALIATLAVPIALVVTLMRTRILLQRGQLTAATVAEIGGAVAQDRQSVKFEYIVNGQTYTAQSSVATAALNEFTPQTTVPVMYDPQKPSRAQVFDHLAGVTVEEPSFISEVAVGVFDYLLFAALMVGQTLGMMMLVGWLAEPYLSAMIGPVVFAAWALTLLELRMIELRQGATGQPPLARQVDDRAGDHRDRLGHAGRHVRPRHEPQLG